MEKEMTNGMGRYDAIQAMKQGKKVTRRYFSDNEWMTMKGEKILLEDGVLCSFTAFWNDRKGESWEDGYSLFV